MCLTPRACGFLRVLLELNPMLPTRMTFVDVETTGTSFKRDRVIEIALIQVENGKVVNQFSSLINPQRHVPDSIFEMTGISKTELEFAPTFREVMQDVGEMLADSIFVAHNAAFDYGFVKNEFRLLEKNYSSKCLCTVKLSRALFPRYKRHNLDSIIERFGFSCESRHRALDDTRVMVEFVNKIVNEFPTDVLDATFGRLLKRPSIPVGVSEKVLNKLHEGPGVYIFYGDTGLPLYIGKSINVKERVLSHFAASSFSTTELSIATQVKDIEVIETAGELSALLKESTLIKKMLPIYNRRLRNASKLYYLNAEVDEAGYKTVSISHKPSDQILGIFKTQKQLRETLATLCEKNNLCKKLLGLEKTKSACFASHLGKCKGACTKKEEPIMYNLRFDMAFLQTKIKSWPFDGPVVISEGDEFLLVEKWRYKKLDVELLEDLKGGIPITFDDGTFDLDTYKILSSYVFGKKQRSIETLRSFLQK